MLEAFEVIFLGLGFIFLMSCAGALTQIKEVLEKIAENLE